MDAAGALARYRAVLETTRQMLDAARAGDWEALVNLEVGRKAAIEAITAQSQGLDYGKLAAQKEACIRSILAADEEITRLTRAWMDEITDILASLQTQRRLAQAYGGG